MKKRKTYIDKIICHWKSIFYKGLPQFLLFSFISKIYSRLKIFRLVYDYLEFINKYNYIIIQNYRKQQIENFVLINLNFS